MRLSNETYEEIKRAFANMLVDYDIKGIPINAFEIAIKIGLKLVPYSTLSKEERLETIKFNRDGFSVEKNDGDWIIYFQDENVPFTRINQTIMHEIGHYILGHLIDGEEEEAEAKFFAKYALASPVLIHHMKSEVTVENVMEEFDIGFQAAGYAIGNYRNWLRFGDDEYTDYEIDIIKQLELEATA